MEENYDFYELPAWRVNQIICLAVKLLNEYEYYKEDFDYKKMIMQQGIKIQKYSSFRHENLQNLQSLSMSLWDEGLCIVFPNPQTSQQCKLIAYNDDKSASEIMTIIFHEYGHIFLKHTEQSINGEMEAYCFSTALVTLLNVEKQFHLGRNIAEKKGKNFLSKNFEKGFSSKAC